MSGEKPPMDLQAFCCQQIQIPPQLPNILKTYTKAAVKTQPRDLLLWSAAYFRALANGEVPPVKERMEYPAQEAESGLTKGLLRILNQQLGSNKTVPRVKVLEKWKAICLKKKYLNQLFEAGGFGQEIPWIPFIALASESIGRGPIPETMRVACTILTEQKDGVDPYIPFNAWWELYIFLAERAKVDGNHTRTVNEYLKGISEGNFGLTGPKDFDHQNCPPLQ